MEESKPIQEVRLSEESLVELEGRIQAATAQAMDAAISREVAERFWLTALDVLRNNAAQASSNILLAALKRLLKNISAFLVLGLTVYAIGGWSGLAALAKVILGRIE